jgi:hypothetical protein
MRFESTNQDVRNWWLIGVVYLVITIFGVCGWLTYGFIGDVFPFTVSLIVNYILSYPGWRINQTVLNRFPIGTFFRVVVWSIVIFCFCFGIDLMGFSKLMSLMKIQGIIPWLSGQFVSFAIADLTRLVKGSVKDL